MGFFVFALFLGIIIGNSVGRKVLRVNEAFQKSQTAKFQSLEVKVSKNWPIRACALYFPV